MSLLSKNRNEKTNISYMVRNFPKKIEVERRVYKNPKRKQQQWKNEKKVTTNGYCEK